MARIDIRVPQMGEGLTEVRLIRLLKKPGDTIQRDDLIYTMETDKATLEVESPETGVLEEWLAAEGDVLPIGAPIAHVTTATSASSDSTDAVPDSAPTEAQSPVATTRMIPPRTRAYAREIGISEQELAEIPCAGARLMPADLDAYKATSGPGARQSKPVGSDTKTYSDRPLADRQRALNYHMKRSAQIVVPGTVSRPIEWQPIRSLVERHQAAEQGTRLTEFQVFAYCAVRALHVNPKFRSALIGDDTVREYQGLNLGVAVSLPDGELTTAVVRDAGGLDFGRFRAALSERIQAARGGQDQADGSVQVHLTYLGSYGIRDAVPVLVSPAVAVLFIGEAYDDGKTVNSNVALTFDHRLINGTEAADLLRRIASECRAADQLELAAPTA